MNTLWMCVYDGAFDHHGEKLLLDCFQQQLLHGVLWEAESVEWLAVAKLQSADSCQNVESASKSAEKASQIMQLTRVQLRIERRSSSTATQQMSERRAQNGEKAAPITFCCRRCCCCCAVIYRDPSIGDSGRRFKYPLRAENRKPLLAAAAGCFTAVHFPRSSLLQFRGP